MNQQQWLFVVLILSTLNLFKPIQLKTIRFAPGFDLIVFEAVNVFEKKHFFSLS